MNKAPKLASEPTIPVFAYGTLQKGHGNAKRCIERYGHEFVGHGTTVEKYVMLNAGIAFVQKPEMYPPLARAKLAEFVGPIGGDLWMVDSDGFEACDSLEGHPISYCRDCVEVEVDGKKYWAWLYFYPHDRRSRGSTFEKPGEDGVVRWNGGRKW